MNILIIHNAYVHRGGEETVVELEAEMLRKYGHTVHLWEPDNRDIFSYEFSKKVSLFWRTAWSSSAYKYIEKLIERHQPEIVHFHNILPLVSPSAYFACKKAGVKIVQTVHNYRMICPGGLLLRSGSICEDCIHSGLTSSIIHGCYQESRLKTLPIAAMLKYHRHRDTWRTLVDKYIFPTSFLQDKILQSGYIEKNQCVIKPHFLPESSSESGDNKYAVFLGRLSREKGIEVLLDAWRDVGDFPLYVIGGGSLEVELEEKYGNLPQIHFVGRLSHENAMEYVANSSFVIIPSICHETFSMPILEAYSRSKPVLSTMMGGMSELIEEGKTGLSFRADDPKDLAAKARWAASHPEEMNKMGETGYQLFSEKYTEESNYKQLSGIYSDLLKL